MEEIFNKASALRKQPTSLFGGVRGLQFNQEEAKIESEKELGNLDQLATNLTVKEFYNSYEGEMASFCLKKYGFFELRQNK